MYKEVIMNPKKLSGYFSIKNYDSEYKFLITELVIFNIPPHLSLYNRQNLHQINNSNHLSD